MEKISKILAENLQGDAALVRKCLDIVQINAPDNSFADKVRALGVTNELLEQGLAFAIEGAKMAEGTDFGWRAGVDMSVARIHRLAGNREAALAAARRALELLEMKGSVPEIASTKALIEELEGD